MVPRYETISTSLLWTTLTGLYNILTGPIPRRKKRRSPMSWHPDTYLLYTLHTQQTRLLALSDTPPPSLLYLPPPCDWNMDKTITMTMQSHEGETILSWFKSNFKISRINCWCLYISTMFQIDSHDGLVSLWHTSRYDEYTLSAPCELESNGDSDDMASARSEFWLAENKAMTELSNFSCTRAQL